MSTLSLRKIKHDSSSVDNVTLNSNGTTTMGSELNVTSLKGVSGNKLQLRSGDSSYGVSLQNVSGIDLLSVDAVGRVTMPYQPSFEVGGAGGLTFTSVGASEYKLTYASVYHNIGNYYSTSTGHFTAPVTGSYLFQAVMMGVNTTSPHITFSINGSAQGGGGNYPNNNLYEHGSYSQNAYWIRTVHIFRLQANDYVRVQSYAYNSVGSPDRCYFGGHLLG